MERVHKDLLHRFVLRGDYKCANQGPVECLVLGIGRGSKSREGIWHMRNWPLKDQTISLLADLKFDHDQMLFMILTL